MDPTPQVAADPGVESVLAALADYRAEHPEAAVDAYRHLRYSVRIRVIDPDFEGKRRAERVDMVWKHLDAHDQREMVWLFLFTPDEAPRSRRNREFENPRPLD